MRIVHIVPGSGGGFYCQNCARDVGLVRALTSKGVDVQFMPMYLPISEMADGTVPLTPVFYGAVNVYLEQKLPFYQRIPERWRQRLDAPRILQWAASKAGTTQAAGLGDLTLSVLQGRDGKQKAELDQMILWLQAQPKIDVVHLSNALLLGLAPTLKAQLDAKVICTLQDEDTWVDALTAPWDENCWEQIRICANSVDAFVSVSKHYAEKMKSKMSIAENQCSVIPPGIDTNVFLPAATPPENPTIGFLSEMTEEYGLDILVDAFLNLRRRPLMGNLRLRATGTCLQRKTPFQQQLTTRIAEAGSRDAVEFTEDFRDAASRSAFLQSLSVLSVPARRPEAFGLFQTEAMACGIPVVQPNIGGYPEVIQATGGGVICNDISPNSLANALYDLLADPAKAASYGQAGRKAVITHYSQEKVAEDMFELYHKTCRQEK